MNVTIRLQPVTQRRLLARATRAELSLEEFIQKLVERHEQEEVDRPEKDTPSFEELTASIAHAVEATGLSDEEVPEFFEGAVAEVRADKRKRLRECRSS
jgi:hypothetical protein